MPTICPHIIFELGGATNNTKTKYNYIDCFGFSDQKLPGFSDEIEENPGTAIETGITLLRHQVAADLFGSFIRIVKNLSWNFC